MLFRSGTTQTTERIINPNSDYLKELPNHLRSFEDVVSYPPNQTYIGNITPEDLKNYGEPWYDKKVKEANKIGKFGEIMPEDEFIGFMKIVDTFDLVKLTDNFSNSAKEKLLKHHFIKEELVSKIKKGEEKTEIERLINEQGAEGLFFNNELVGCIKRAHDIDINLSAHVMFENIAVKASGAIAALNLIDKNNINPEDVEYIIECSEEACGDMNQRGGGNFAKSIAEVAEFINATGSDTRGFCAGPTHSIIEAAALVQSKIYNVVVVGGGSTAKLGMNGKDHV